MTLLLLTAILAGIFAGAAGMAAWCCPRYSDLREAFGSFALVMGGAAAVFATLDWWITQ